LQQIHCLYAYDKGVLCVLFIVHLACLTKFYSSKIAGFCFLVPLCCRTALFTFYLHYWWDVVFFILLFIWGNFCGITAATCHV